MRVLIGQATYAPDFSDIIISTAPFPDKVFVDSDLESDFQKDGIPASVAPGFPKLWTAELWKFSSGDNRGTVTAASATSDEKYLAISVANRILIYTIAGFELVTVLEASTEYDGQSRRIEFANGEQGGYVLAVDYLVTSSMMAQIIIWHLDDKGELVAGTEETPVRYSGSFPTFISSCFNNNGDTLLYISTIHEITGPHLQITALDFRTGKEKFVMGGHLKPVTSVAFSPSNKLIASTSFDGYLKLYDGETGQPIRNFGPTGGQNWTCEFSPDSNNIAVSRGSDTFVWNTCDPQSFPIELKGERGWRRVIRWAPDGQRIAVGAADGRLVVYNARSLAVDQVWQLSGDEGQRWMKEVTELNWLEGGKRLLFKPSDGSVRIYDFESNQKWKWGPGEKDEWRSGAWFNTTIVMEGKGLFGSIDQDGNFRVWKIPTE